MKRRVWPLLILLMAAMLWADTLSGTIPNSSVVQYTDRSQISPLPSSTPILAPILARTMKLASGARLSMVVPIPGLTGSTTGLSGSFDTDVNDYGKYPIISNGQGLAGGPLLEM
jgi:hypothetical protein